MHLVAFAPHPDDAELGMGATLAQHAAMGRRVAVVDLTRGEMATNGSVQERRQEAEAASAVLGLALRQNLGLPDRGLQDGGDQLWKVVHCIRRLQPEIVAIPYWDDPHPDHGAASRLVEAAVFNARLPRYDTGQPAWRVQKAVFYFINAHREPSFVIDVSDAYEKKRQALACYASQFVPGEGRGATRLNEGGVLRLVEARDMHFGAVTGCRFAEGFVVKGPVRLPDLSRLTAWEASV